jgi:DNA-binding NarL/FixJ family response regulator
MSSIKVLIVDDVIQVRRELRTLLTLAGNIEVVGEAGHGSEAVLQAEILRPDVVLMDLEMPVMNGFEATRRIKAKLPDCRVIVLTIYADAVTRQRAISAGADLFLEKGTPIDTLLAAISRGHKLSQENPESLRGG